ncbi:MAG: adenylate kinase family protein [Chloroflexota bacterium]
MSLYLIMMGVQGSGKGTQAAYISQKYGIPHVSTGDLFRAMKTREDPLARRVQDIMKSGALVDDDTTNEVLKDRLEQPDAAAGAILDGYPRNINQARWLAEYLNSRSLSLSGVLLLELDLYTAFKRAFGRVLSEQTGETYNIFFHTDVVNWTVVEHPERAYPPRLDAVLTATGEPLKRRPDDEAFSVIKRIDTYVETTRPLIDYYSEQGLLVTVEADQPIDEVNQAVEAAIAQMRD